MSTKQMEVPRIRGRLATGDDGKHYFELSLWDFYGKKKYTSLEFGPFDTEKIASEKMKAACQKICDRISEEMGEKPTGQYLDFKNGGVLRSWVEH